MLAIGEPARAELVREPQPGPLDDDDAVLDYGARRGFGGKRTTGAVRIAASVGEWRATRWHRLNRTSSRRRMVQAMPTRIVMVNGDEFVVDMGVDVAASEILGAEDPRAKLDADVEGETQTKTVWVMRKHIAYAEAYVYPESRVSRA
jgi:hypothetical protein